jgi:NADH-quinone oxidoreductase subunit H
VGTLVTALGLAFIVFPHVNAFIQAPFWFLSKVLLFLFVYVWMRGTLPRFRYDQLMAFGWKLLLPLSLVNVALTSFLIVAKMQWGAK